MPIRAQLNFLAVPVPSNSSLLDFQGLPIGVSFNYLNQGTDWVNTAELVYPEAITEPTFYALKSMEVAAAQDGVILTTISGFRALKTQQIVFKKYGAKRAEKPGYSEHHLGTTVDFAGVTQTSESFLWLLENAFAFGFVPTYYFRSSEDGLMKEPWHWRYVGRESARQFVGLWREQYQLEIARLRFAKSNTAGF